MTYDEALAWMNGERSTVNTIPIDPFETYELRIAQTDAARMQQAYWVIKAMLEFRASQLTIKEG